MTLYRISAVFVGMFLVAFSFVPSQAQTSTPTPTPCNPESDPDCRYDPEWLATCQPILEQLTPTPTSMFASTKPPTQATPTSMFATATGQPNYTPYPTSMFATATPLVTKTATPTGTPTGTPTITATPTGVYYYGSIFDLVTPPEPETWGGWFTYPTYTPDWHWSGGRGSSGYVPYVGYLLNYTTTAKIYGYVAEFECLTNTGSICGLQNDDVTFSTGGIAGVIRSCVLPFDASLAFEYSLGCDVATRLGEGVRTSNPDFAGFTGFNVLRHRLPTRTGPAPARVFDYGIITGEPVILTPTPTPTMTPTPIGVCEYVAEYDFSYTSNPFTFAEWIGSVGHTANGSARLIDGWTQSGGIELSAKDILRDAIPPIDLPDSKTLKMLDIEASAWNAVGTGGGIVFNIDLSVPSMNGINSIEPPDNGGDGWQVITSTTGHNPDLTLKKIIFEGTGYYDDISVTFPCEAVSSIDYCLNPIGLPTEDMGWPGVDIEDGDCYTLIPGGSFSVPEVDMIGFAGADIVFPRLILCTQYAVIHPFVILNMTIDPAPLFGLVAAGFLFSLLFRST